MNKPYRTDKGTQGFGRRTRRGNRGRGEKSPSKQEQSAPQNRHLLILTGPPESGKSELLQHWKALAGDRMALMDPLEGGALATFPDNADLEMVAIDHADWLPDAPAYVRTLSNWAQKRGILLLLSVERESWLHNKGIAPPKDPIHLTLDGKGGERGVIFTYMGNAMYATRDEIDQEITAPRGQEDADVEQDEEVVEE